MFVDNSWVAEVGTSPASMNPTMSTKNSTSVKLKDIYVLPLWLCLE